MTKILSQADGLAHQIGVLRDIIARDSTPPGERSAAERALNRLLTKVDKAAKDGQQEVRIGDRYYRMPERVYGAKHDLVRHMSTKEIAQVVRQDIAFARKLGKQTAKKGAVKFPDPIGDAPAQVRFYVSMRYGCPGTITVTVKNVPDQWWEEREDHNFNPPRPYREPQEPLQTLGTALHDLLWSYNYDASDPMVDLVDKRFYQHVRAHAVDDKFGQEIYRWRR